MINIKSYGSGSEGNLYYLTSNDTKIILECGVETSKIENMLIENKILATDINACITSHSHIDHSCNINFFQDYNVHTFCTKDTISRYRMMMNSFNPPHILEHCKMFKVKNLLFMPFNVNHGSTECFGFLIKDTIDDYCVLFATDFCECKCDFRNFKFNQIFIECNYVDENLKNAIIKDKDNKSEAFLQIKHKRQLNTHMSLDNLLVILNSIDLSNCDKITLIHVSNELGDREMMTNKVIEELGVNCVALCSNGKEI